MKSEKIENRTNDNKQINSEFENPTSEEVIARLQIAIQMNIEKYGYPDPNKPIKRKFTIYKGWPKEDDEEK